MKLMDCYKFRDKDKIKESYWLHPDGNGISANIDKENMKYLISAFIRSIPGTGFFFLELPLNEFVEKKLRKNDKDSFHKAVYYLEEKKPDELLKLFNKYCDILLNGAPASFGFACHEVQMEIIISEFNVVVFFAENINLIINLLERMEITEDENFLSAWDLFTSENIGVVVYTKVNGISVFDLPEIMKNEGLHFYEIQDAF